MNTKSESKTQQGISGSTLKIIAIITMLIDHIGASLLEPAIIHSAQEAGITTWSYPQLFGACPNLMIPYAIFRLAGRISFPIFCFLLIEGFLHTRNLGKYMIRLAVFAFISEIPFDLAFSGKIVYASYQNVFFTLLLGLLTITMLEYIAKHFSNQNLFCTLCNIVSLAAGMALAELLKTDYGAMGVLTITAMYLFRKNRVLEMLSGCIILTLMNFIEVTSFIGILPVKLYNGKRGLNLKYFFYAFYPVHLFLLYLICRIINIY